jgi:hypothetical protein
MHFRNSYPGKCSPLPACSVCCKMNLNSSGHAPAFRWRCEELQLRKRRTAQERSEPGPLLQCISSARMGCPVNEGKLLHPTCSCKQAASFTSKSGSYPVQGPEFVVGGAMRHTFLACCHQLDDQILPLPRVGNKDRRRKCETRSKGGYSSHREWRLPSR